jgi:PAS domain S-box-containing protein
LRIRRREWANGLDFRQLSDTSPDTILITDTKGNIIYVNASWEKLTGYAFTEVIGKNPGFLDSGKTPKKVHKRLWEALHAGKSYRTDDVFNKRKDGTLYQVHSTFYPIMHNSRNLYFVQMQYDITQHRALEKKLKERDDLLQLIISNANGYAIFMLDKKGRILSWNPGAERLTGYTGEEVIGKYY